jgi:hypothetical protein
MYLYAAMKTKICLLFNLVYRFCKTLCRKTNLTTTNTTEKHNVELSKRISCYYKISKIAK